MTISNTPICILGYSGHGLVVAEALHQSGFAQLWFADEDQNRLNPLHLNYAGNDSESGFDWNRFDGFALGIGDNATRARVGKNVLDKSRTLFSAIHPSSILSSDIQLEGGCLIAAGAIVNPQVKLKEGVIINTGAIVEHECEIDAYAHIAPGAVLAGNVFVGEQSFVGANSVVKQGVKIGANVTIGAGSVVLNDIPDNSTYVGNPAKPIRS
jgi:sugar O-acyltransferase (sialic acid O-acetyltransferase NeuD family)